MNIYDIKTNDVRNLKPDTGTMKKYIDAEGRTVVETEELSFLTDHAHRYGWLRRHFLHHRLRLALKKADKVKSAKKVKFKKAKKK